MHGRMKPGTDGENATCLPPNNENRGGIFNLNYALRGAPEEG